MLMRIEVASTGRTDVLQMARKLLQQGLDCRIFILECAASVVLNSLLCSLPVTRRRWWMTAFLSALNIDMGFR